MVSTKVKMSHSVSGGIAEHGVSEQSWELVCSACDPLLSDFGSLGKLLLFSVPQPLHLYVK